MCKFEYKKFDTCGDHFIEIHDFCHHALWKAGVQGVLQVCVPEILGRSLEWSGPNDYEPPLVAEFTGYEGFCEVCVDKYMVSRSDQMIACLNAHGKVSQLPPTIPSKTYSDYRLDYQTHPSTFDPHSLAPYISIRCVVARIPDLLGICDQFDEFKTDQGPYIIFPKLVEQMTWCELRNRVPFKITGVMEEECHLDLPQVLEKLNVSGGISWWDKFRISKAIEAGVNLRALYDILFKPRGISLVDYDAILECLRANAIQLLTKKAEVLREQDSLQQEPEVSDISTLTSLGTTPELSDLDVDLPTQSITPAKAANKRNAQLRDKPEYTQKSGISEKGKPTLTSRPSAKKSMKKKAMSTYEAEQSTDEAVVSPSPAPRSTAAEPAKKQKKESLVPPPMDLDGRLRQVAEQGQKIAEQKRTIEQVHQREPAFVDSGSRNTAQPLLGGGPLDAVEQTPGGTTVGNRTAGNATTDESAGTSPENGSWTVRGSAAGNPDPEAQPAHGNESSPQCRGTKRTFGFANAVESQRPQGAQQPHVTQNAAAIQGLWQQRYVNSILPMLPPETIQDLAQSTGNPLFQGAAAVLSRPRLPASSGWQQHVHDVPELPPILTQLSEFGSQQPPYGLSQLPQTPTRPSRLGSQQLAHSLPQLAQTPAQPSHSGSQQLANGLPQLSQTPTQLSLFGSQYSLPGLSQLPQTPTRPSQIGLPRLPHTPTQQAQSGVPWLPDTSAQPPRSGSQQLAQGFPQLPPQGSSQSPQGAQYLQGFGRPRDGTQDLASLRRTLPVSPVGDGDEDLQISDRDAWMSSNRKRRAP